MDIIRGDDMSFTRILSSDTKNKGVIGLPDTPGLSTENMQKKFDELALDVIIPKLNGLMSELEASAAAASLGASVPDGIDAEKNIQSILAAIAVLASEASKVAGEAKQIAASAQTQIEVAVNASNAALVSANQAVNIAQSIAYMVDPVTGQLLPIDQVINNMYDAIRPAPLTAGEYDALGLTAAEFDAFQITARNYDMYGKNILTN